MRREDSSEGHPASPTRRHFIKAGMAGGVAAAACSNLPQGLAAAPAAVPTFELDEITIAKLQKRMNAGELTAHVAAEKYLARIEAIDRHGPALHSVIELNPDALAIAAALDRERRERGPRGPLHGIPILIKDNIDTADAMATTAGSLALVGSRPPRDAFVVRLLRRAGAVILGKTNLSEWANFRSERSTSGWSGRGGLTKNPYALDRNPSGSSSGSGTAAAANLCAVAVGTETDGSIISPSTACGLVGLKPTLGLVSRSGIIPIAHSQDTAGPMGRTVRDVAILLGVLAGADAEDPATAPARANACPDYTRFLDPRGLHGMRLGVVRHFFGFHDGVDALMADALSVLTREGATLIDPVHLTTAGKFDDSELTVLLYEFKADLNAYLARLGPAAPVRTLQEIIAFNDHNRDREMPFFGQETLAKAQAKGPLTSREYLDALAKNHRLSRQEGIDALMARHNLDALVAPSGGPAHVTDLVDGDHYIGGSTTPAAVAGYPSITVPAGFVFGLPVGISFFGRAWTEPKLLRLAYAFEQATRFRKSPQFLPTANLGAGR